MRAIGVMLTCILCMVVLACSGSSGAPEVPVGAVCVAGQSVFCAGSGGCAGGQACKSDGSGYGDCVCGAAGSDGGLVGSGNDASSPGADAGSGSDADPQADGATDNDGSVEADGALACVPSACPAGGQCTVPVCSNGSCSLSYAAEGATCTGGKCDAQGRCQICGGDGKACCPGQTCDFGFGCDNTTNTCFACGQASQVCCPGAKQCLHSNLFCASDNTCK
jgi:hypothetical protein